ncbi:MAG: c-type cytochrome [Alphaproteobacteria bacterium]
MKRSSIWLAALMIFVAGNAWGAGAPPELAVKVCSTCHGAEGRSIAPTFPELAGQKAAYLETQLHAFRDRSRADPHAQAYMWGMASQLTDDVIKELAGYYAAQSPAPGTAQDPAEVAAGQKIFADGIAAEQVPACATCHGAKAEGTDIAPRLAGQHREYLAAQLLAFKNALRANDVMHENVKNINDEQIRQVAAYLASQ